MSIKSIRLGEEVAAIDEKSGQLVWRKVVETSSRQARSTVELVVQDKDGNRTKIVTTEEHPFHVEDWDAASGQLLAALDGTDYLPAHMLMPTDGETPFGDWVKAGALKPGDALSTAASITGQSGPTKAAALLRATANGDGATPLSPLDGGISGRTEGGLPSRPVTPEQLAALGIEAANDNDPVLSALPDAKPVSTFAGKALTVLDVLRDNSAKRVYNFEVESLPGEITHNYLVGDDLVWVHNARFNSAWARKKWEKHFGRDWPKDGDGRNLDVHHEYPVCDFPDRKYDPTNMTPMFKFGHRLLHSLSGDSARWGAMGGRR